MEIDSFVDCECCFEKSICCIGSLSEKLLNCFSYKLIRYLLVIAKLGGIILDGIAIWQLMQSEAFSFLIVSIVYNAIDRGGALLMVWCYGYKPTEKFQDYAYFLEAAGKIKNREGILSLYYGSLFSVSDFMGQIWKSYTFAIKVDARKIAERKRTKSNLDQTIDLGKQRKNTNTNIQMTTQIAPTHPTPQPKVELSDGWSARVDPQGRVYYQNEITKQTQWNIPIVIPIEKNTPNTEEQKTVKYRRATTDNSTRSVSVFAFFYIITITILMITTLVIAILSIAVGTEEDNQLYGEEVTLGAVLMVVSTTVNAAGLLQHFINILTGTIKKCKAKKKDQCCLFGNCCLAAGGCFGTIIAIIGVVMFILIEAMLISPWFNVFDKIY